MIGFVVAGDALFLGVPGERSAGLQRQVGEDAAGCRDVALFDIGHGLASVVDGSEEILHVVADGRGDVALEVFFGFVLGIFLEFVGDVAMGGLALPALRNEIIAVHAGFERALVAIERGAPAVLGIGRIAPGAVLPDDFQVVVIEGGGWRVGDVGLAGLVHQDAAG